MALDKLSDDPRVIEDIKKQIRDAWAEYKAAHNVSQIEAARHMNMRQGAFNQYLRGAIDPNVPFLLKFGALVGKTFSFGDETMESLAMRHAHTRTMQVKNETNGQRRDEIFTYLSPSLQSYLIYLSEDTNLMPKGGYLVVDPSAQIREGDTVVLKSRMLDTEQTIGKIFFERGKWIVVSNDPTGQEVTRTIDDKLSVEAVVSVVAAREKDDLPLRVFK